MDTEFLTQPGEGPRVLCLVAEELHTGRVVAFWENELTTATPLPFGPADLLVAYSATAELDSLISMGWPLPQHVLDLFPEFRLNVNVPKSEREKASGAKVARYGLLNALRYYGIPSISDAGKEKGRGLVMEAADRDLTEIEKAFVLRYCKTDVDALKPLLDAMIQDGLDLTRAVFHRGRYALECSKMWARGIPVDSNFLHRLEAHWTDVEALAIQEVEASLPLPVFEGSSLRASRFVELLKHEKVKGWPKTRTGQPKTASQTVMEMSEQYPQFLELAELIDFQRKMRLGHFPVGQDGRNRCDLKPFMTVTGRNAPSNAEFSLLATKALRSVIRPELGKALIYADFKAQEVAVAAALSRDEKLWEVYQEPDPYIRFGEMIGVWPPGATKKTHPKLRDQLKISLLSLSYGASAFGLHKRTGMTLRKARLVVRRHRKTFRAFWRWAFWRIKEAQRKDGNGQFVGIETTSGWRARPIDGEPFRFKTWLNWSIQAAGADILRESVIMLSDEGIKVLAPLHDAVLVECSEADLGQTEAKVLELMKLSSKNVVGREIRVSIESKPVYPERLVVLGDSPLWTRLERLIATAERRKTLCLTGT